MVTGEWFLFVRTDCRLFGPYGSEAEVGDAARRYFGTDGFDHATVNGDWLALEREDGRVLL